MSHITAHGLEVAVPPGWGGRVSQPLFAREGMPRELDPEDFDPAGLQRGLDGHAGRQGFFHEAGRAFCLIVLGAYARRSVVVPAVNNVLANIRIDEAVG